MAVAFANIFMGKVETMDVANRGPGVHLSPPSICGHFFGKIYKHLLLVLDTQFMKLFCRFISLPFPQRRVSFAHAAAAVQLCYM